MFVRLCTLFCLIASSFCAPGAPVISPITRVEQLDYYVNFQLDPATPAGVDTDIVSMQASCQPNGVWDQIDITSPTGTFQIGVTYTANFMLQQGPTGIQCQFALINRQGAISPWTPAPNTFDCPTLRIYPNQPVFSYDIRKWNQAAQSSVKLHWKSAFGTPGTNFNGTVYAANLTYTIFIYSTSGSLIRSVPGFKTNWAIIDGLTSGVTYNFTVRAVNFFGLSSADNPLAENDRSIKSVVLTVGDDAITNVQVNAINSWTTRVTFTPPRYAFLKRETGPDRNHPDCTTYTVNVGTLVNNKACVQTHVLNATGYDCNELIIGGLSAGEAHAAVISYTHDAVDGFEYTSTSQPFSFSTAALDLNEVHTSIVLQRVLTQAELALVPSSVVVQNAVAILGSQTASNRFSFAVNTIQVPGTNGTHPATSFDFKLLSLVQDPAAPNVVSPLTGVKAAKQLYPERIFKDLFWLQALVDINATASSQVLIQQSAPSFTYQYSNCTTPNPGSLTGLLTGYTITANASSASTMYSSVLISSIAMIISMVFGFLFIHA